MKRKIQLKKGLTINKETISKLQESQMASIRGGQGDSRKSCANGSCIESCNKNSCNKIKIADILSIED